MTLLSVLNRTGAVISLAALLGAPAAALGSYTIQRDVYGVPHIDASSGASDRGAYHGLGYTCAQDRLYQMLYLRAMARGELSQYLPQPVDDPDPKVRESLAYIDNDIAARTYGLARQAKRIYERMDLSTSRLLQAYADGVNKALNEVLDPPPPAQFVPPDGVPLEIEGLLKTIDGSANCSPWTPEDSIAIWLRFSLYQGWPGAQMEVANWVAHHSLASDADPNNDDDFVPCNKVFDEEAAVVQLADVDPGLPAAIASWYSGTCSLPPGPAGPGPMLLLNDDAHFSQAWAVGASELVDTNVNAVLFGHPQLVFGLPGHFWEAHVKGKTFEVRGMCVVGTPNFFVGSNGALAWSVTALGIDSADAWILQVNTQVGANGVGTRYKQDGVMVGWAVDEIESFRPKGWPADVKVRYRETAYGPVVTDSASTTAVGTEYEISGVVDLDVAMGKKIGCAEIDPPPDIRTELESTFGTNPGVAVRWVTFEPYSSPALPVPPPTVVDSSVGYSQLYKRTALDASTYAALENVAVPSINWVLASRAGDVGYFAGGKLAVRECTQPYAGLMAQDGRFSTSKWKQQFVPSNFKPWVTNPSRGYVASANHLPVGSWYPIPLVRAGGYTDRARRLTEMLDLVVGQPTVTPAQVRGLFHDQVLTRSRDFYRLADHVEQNSAPGMDYAGHSFSSNAADALVHLRQWYQAGTPNGRIGADVADSAIALFGGGTPFSPENTSTDLVLDFGTAEPAVNFWLRCRVARLVEQSANCECPAPSVSGTDYCAVTPKPILSADEIAFLDQVLCETWCRVNERVRKDDLTDTTCGATGTTCIDPPKDCTNGCPYACTGLDLSPYFDCWYDASHMTIDLDVWGVSLAKLPPLHNATSPFQVEKEPSIGTIVSLTGQSYSQFVQLGDAQSGSGPLDAAESVLPIGQSDRWSQCHYDSQRCLWEKGLLKPSPGIFPTALPCSGGVGACPIASCAACTGPVPVDY